MYPGSFLLWYRSLKMALYFITISAAVPWLWCKWQVATWKIGNGKQDGVRNGKQKWEFTQKPAYAEMRWLLLYTSISRDNSAWLMAILFTKNSAQQRTSTFTYCLVLWHNSQHSGINIKNGYTCQLLTNDTVITHHSLLQVLQILDRHLEWSRHLYWGILCMYRGTDAMAARAALILRGW